MNLCINYLYLHHKTLLEYLNVSQVVYKCYYTQNIENQEKKILIVTFCFNFI